MKEYFYDISGFFHYGLLPSEDGIYKPPKSGKYSILTNLISYPQKSSFSRLKEYFEITDSTPLLKVMYQIFDKLTDGEFRRETKNIPAVTRWPIIVNPKDELRKSTWGDLQYFRASKNIEISAADRKMNFIRLCMMLTYYMVTLRHGFKEWIAIYLYSILRTKPDKQGDISQLHAGLRAADISAALPYRLLTKKNRTLSLIQLNSLGMELYDQTIENRRNLLEKYKMETKFGIKQNISKGDLAKSFVAHIIDIAERLIRAQDTINLKLGKNLNKPFQCNVGKYLFSAMLTPHNCIVAYPKITNADKNSIVKIWKDGTQKLRGIDVLTMTGRTALTKQTMREHRHHIHMEVPNANLKF